MIRERFTYSTVVAAVVVLVAAAVAAVAAVRVVAAAAVEVVPVVVAVVVVVVVVVEVVVALGHLAGFATTAPLLLILKPSVNTDAAYLDGFRSPRPVGLKRPRAMKASVREAHGRPRLVHGIRWTETTAVMVSFTLPSQMFCTDRFSATTENLSGPGGWASGLSSTTNFRSSRIRGPGYFEDD